MSKLYKSIDGKEFYSEEERQNYYDKNGLKAFSVFFGKDLNTGNYDTFENHMIILIRCKEKHELFIEHYLYEQFENRIAFIQGAYNIDCLRVYWTFHETNVHEEYINKPIAIKKIEVGVCPWWKDSIKKLKDI